jgi:predicted dehydrogenase
MERRLFLAGGAAAASRIPGANDRLRGGLIGAGGRGRLVTGDFKEVGAEIGAVCDVYEGNLNAGLKAASTGAKPYDDYRRMLEDKSLDFVIVATPDHWHARMTVDAVEAGKDVYVEKPMAHTIPEGFQIIEATRRTKRVVQVGTQRRSYDIFLEAKKIMDSGQLGDVHLVNAWWVHYRAGLGQRKIEGKLDWKQWLGPAPKRPFDPVRFSNWYYFYDYSGGLLIGQAAHVIDAINWMMNSTAPLTVTCTGMKPNLEGAEVPETATMAIEYPERYLAVFTLGYKAMRYSTTNDQMKQFHGTKARFDLGRESYALYPQSLQVDMTPSITCRRPKAFDAATRSHIRNFLECIRSRRDPNAPVEAGQATNIVLVMALDSLRSGRRLTWNAAERKVQA